MNSNEMDRDLVLENINTKQKFVLNRNVLMHTCGRLESNAICCRSNQVSREHCIFFRTTQEMNVMDLESANGIYVNGVRMPVNMRIKLRINDIIGLGQSCLTPVLTPTRETEDHYIFQLQIHSGIVNANANANENVASLGLPETTLNNNEQKTSEHKRRMSRGSMEFKVPFKIAKIEQTIAPPDIIDITDELNGHNGNGEIVIISPASISNKNIQGKTSDSISSKEIGVFGPKIKSVANEANVTVSTSNDTSKHDRKKSVVIDTYQSDESSKNTKSSKIQVTSIPEEHKLKTKDQRGTIQTFKENGEKQKTVEARNRVKKDLIDAFGQLSRMKDQLVPSRCDGSNSPLFDEIESLKSPILSDKCRAEMLKNAEESVDFIMQTVDEEDLNLQDRMDQEESHSDSDGSNPSVNPAQEIKYEKELHITDTDESVYLNFSESEDMAYPSPIKLKRVKQEPTTRYSQTDVVILSDDEDNIFPASQLFDDELDTEDPTKTELKDEEVFDEIKDMFDDGLGYTDIIELSDSDDDDNPWLARLSRSQMLNESREIKQELIDTFNSTDEDFSICYNEEDTSESRFFNEHNKTDDIIDKDKHKNKREKKQVKHSDKSEKTSNKAGKKSHDKRKSKDSNTKHTSSKDITNKDKDISMNESSSKDKTTSVKVDHRHTPSDGKVHDEKRSNHAKQKLIDTNVTVGKDSSGHKSRDSNDAQKRSQLNEVVASTSNSDISKDKPESTRRKSNDEKQKSIDTDDIIGKDPAHKSRDSNEAQKRSLLNEVGSTSNSDNSKDKSETTRRKSNDIQHSSEQRSENPIGEPVVLLTKLESMRRELQLVEPPFLANGEGRGVSCNVKKIDRSVNNQGLPLVSANNAQPETSAEIPTTKESKEFGDKLSTKEKKEIASKNKFEDALYLKEQKRRRAKNKWADCLPPGKKKSVHISREEKEQIKNERKEKLKNIADKEKNITDRTSPMKRTAGKPRAKVTIKTRGDFLISEQQDSIAKPSISTERIPSETDNTAFEKQKIKRKTVDPTKEAKTNGEMNTETTTKSVVNESTRTSSSNLDHRKNYNIQNYHIPKSKPTIAKPKTSREGLEKTVQEPKIKIPNILLNNISQKNSATTECSTKSQVTKPRKSLLKENRPPNGNEESVRRTTTKRVSFNDLATTIDIFEIDPGNSLRKCVSKDAPIHMKKLAKRYAADTKACPKLEQFLLHIFQWNPVWLQEQKRLGTAPPVVDEKKLVPMLSKYSTYEDYYNITQPLLALELWYGIAKDYEVKEKNPKRPVIMFSIVNNSITATAVPSTKVRVTNLMLEVVASKRDIQLQAHPVYGDLIYFEYVSTSKENQHRFCKVFAYVTNVCQTVIAPFTHFNRDLLTFVKDPYVLLTYTVMTKPLEPNIHTNRVQRLRTIAYLRSNMRMIQALQYLPISPLLNQILNPKIEDYQLPSAANWKNYNLVTKDKLNCKQLEAVVRVTETVVQKLPKICLIQGPPGTGKSKVIVNLVTEILYGGNRNQNKRPMRILVCAPSNAAIDEIVLRLLEIRRSFKEKQNRFKMVRIGRHETMHPLAKDLSLAELAKRDVKRTTENYLSPSFTIESVEEEKRFLEARINALESELTYAKKSGAVYTQHIMRKLTDIRAKYDLLTNRRPAKGLDPKELGRLQKAAENTLLAGADVIACTLSSCYTNQMESIFAGSGETISVCIVDEATQSAEVETLIPLMLGITTLVLVGDTNQLPATVISQEARQLGFSTSLFSRIQNVFDGAENNPIILLDTQYRMAYPIAYWPNRYFYSGALKNAANLKNLPFHFYKVINLDSIQDTDKFSNTDEATFVANLFYTILALSNLKNATLPIKVGIITPYNNQRTLISTKINERIAPLPDQVRKKMTVEVNTVDSFQGQERDFIIMSCVRSNGIGFLSDRQRLCVALTRAKHSLMLCGNFSAFERDPMWNELILDAKSRGVYLKIKANADPEQIKPYVVR